jgi:hypothetical protein
MAFYVTVLCIEASIQIKPREKILCVKHKFINSIGKKEELPE